MKTLLSFLAVLAVSVLAMALGSDRVDPGALLPAVGTAALLAAASTDRLPRRRAAVKPPSRPGTRQPWLQESRCVLCAGPAS